MDFANSIIINASKETIFAHYADVANWPIWDKEVKAVTLGGLDLGSRGSLQPRSGPRAMITISALTPNTSFTVTSKLPWCKMQFCHELTSTGETTKATHSVGFSGPLAFLFRRLIGREIERALPATLQGLKDVSEQRLRTAS